ncbi:MAG: AraC family transcriptional regulator ligand-binding domain-containing protein [Chryseolinea sp.]
MGDQQNQFILSLLGYAVQRGISAQKLCELCNIGLEDMKIGLASAPSKKQINDLWKNAAHLCNDPLFGLHFGESLQLSALGAVGEIIKSSDTVGQAITIAASFTPAIVKSFTMEVKKSKTIFVIRLLETDSKDDDFVTQQVADLLMVFTVHELNGLLLRKISPISVSYPRKISDPVEYERVFRCRPKRSGDYSISFEAGYWDEPILTANYELQKLFLQKVNSESNGKLPSISFQVTILNYLAKNAYLGILSLEDVAANFNMSPRSLQRRLQEESVTFQQLADSVRKSLALHYLESGKYQIKEISNILGYNELSAFSRAFKRWTGKAPIEYQG